jgi:ABC-type transport system substrate-binding protein
MISKSGRNGYSSLFPRMDPLTDEIRVEMDRERPKALCSEAQKIAAEDLQYLPMWFGDAVSVHRKDLGIWRCRRAGIWIFWRSCKYRTDTQTGRPS